MTFEIVPCITISVRYMQRLLLSNVTNIIRHIQRLVYFQRDVCMTSHVTVWIRLIWRFYFLPETFINRFIQRSFFFPCEGQLRHIGRQATFQRECPASLHESFVIRLCDDCKTVPCDVNNIFVCDVNKQLHMILQNIPWDVFFMCRIILHCKKHLMGRY